MTRVGAWQEGSRNEDETRLALRIGDFEVTPREGGHAHDLPFPPIAIDPKRVATETPVRDLNFDLKRLQAAHDDGSHGTRPARSCALAQAADALHELGCYDIGKLFSGRRRCPLVPKERGRLIAVAGLAAAVAVGSGKASSQEQVNWDMQSAFASSFRALGTSGVRFSDRVRSMSGGRFDLTFHEPGALAPALETFRAVSAGTIDAGWTTSGYHTGTLGEGITFFTSVPFGPNFGEFLAWKQHGGGQELREELYNAHGVTALDSFCIGPETSGWFKEEITDPARQLRGLKMRFFGLGAKVMEKMGVSTVLLAGRDILPALRSGEIDATEFSMPMVDINLRFHEEATYNYFPGWHQQVSCSELLMNEQRYDALPEAYRSMLKAAGGPNRPRLPSRRRKPRIRLR